MGSPGKVELSNRKINVAVFGAISSDCHESP